MAQFHGLPADEARLRHEYGGAAFDVTMLLHAAKSLGFAAKAVRQPPQRLHKAPRPCIAIDKEGRFFILAKVDAGGRQESQQEPQQWRFLIQRPGEAPQALVEAPFPGQ